MKLDQQFKFNIIRFAKLIYKQNYANLHKFYTQILYTNSTHNFTHKSIKLFFTKKYSIYLVIQNN